MTGSAVESERTKVIYVLGWGRSGSTLFANVLATLIGGASLGEVRYLWDRGLGENRRCGCGEVFHDCGVWREILERSGFRNSGFSWQQLARRVGSGARPQQMPAILRRRLDAYRAERARETDVLDQIYVAASRVLDVDTIVDASKSPFYGVNLLSSEKLAPCFVHLTRDPRGVVYSWMRPKAMGETTRSGESDRFPRYGVLRAGLQWNVVNGFCDRIGRLAGAGYVRVSYEDFVEQPARTLRVVLDAFGMAPKEGADEGPSRVWPISMQHSISGNPTRFIKDNVVLKADTEWKSNLGKRERWLIRRICGQRMRHYGYLPAA